MVYSIIIIDEKAFYADIKKIPKNIREVVMDKIGLLSVQWIEHAQVKYLHNYDIADYRIRVGDYRVLFNFFPEKSAIHIIAIRHRKNAYK